MTDMSGLILLLMVLKSKTLVAFVASYVKKSYKFAIGFTGAAYFRSEELDFLSRQISNIISYLNISLYSITLRACVRTMSLLVLRP